MKNQQFLALIILSLSLTSALCGLKISSPANVKKTFSDGIPNQVTRFGKIPSGSSLTGTLMVADPIEACTSITTDLFKQEQVPIFIAKNGGCKYVIKAMYAQLAGAKMLIIVDKTDDLPKDPVGHDIGFDISIPTIIIPKTKGEKLIAAVEEAAKKSKDKSVIATMSFPYGLASTTVSLQYFFSSADTTNNAYKFIRDFKDIYSKAGDSFKFEPHYVTWYCAPCKELNFATTNEDCVSGGRYCAPDPDNEGPLQGRDVVMEDLRQICLWRNYPSTWWSYVDKFEKCINSNNQKSCGERVLKDVGLSSDQISSVDRCVEKSFEGSDKNRDDNSILRDERIFQDDFDISMFPTLFINYQQYMNSLGDAVSVLKAACDSLQTPTALCNQYFQDRIIVNSFDTGSVILFTLVLLVIVVIILFFYRRMARREMTKEMSIQVSQMVSQYFALNDLNESKGKADEL